MRQQVVKGSPIRIGGGLGLFFHRKYWGGLRGLTLLNFPLLYLDTSRYNGGPLRGAELGSRRQLLRSPNVDFSPQRGSDGHRAVPLFLQQREGHNGDDSHLALPDPGLGLGALYLAYSGVFQRQFWIGPIYAL